MNKIGTLDIIKAYLGNKELSANNAYIGDVKLIKGSSPEPSNDYFWAQLDTSIDNSSTFTLKFDNTDNIEWSTDKETWSNTYLTQSDTVDITDTIENIKSLYPNRVIPIRGSSKFPAGATSINTSDGIGSTINNGGRYKYMCLLMNNDISTYSNGITFSTNTGDTINISNNHIFEYISGGKTGISCNNTGSTSTITSTDINSKQVTINNQTTVQFVETNKNNKIYLRSITNTNRKIINKSTTNYYKIGGNILSLFDYSNMNVEIATDVREMFRDCTSLTSAVELILPATTLANNCYLSMFNGCTALTNSPTLPATTLANYCYYGMFLGCKSLTSAPVLPATTLAEGCYLSMFNGCTSLTSAPALPATTLANYCYNNMFNGCTSLTSAPELPATTLANNCYLFMFEACTSLTSAPALPATTLAERCYYWMFDSCTSLTSAPILPATTLAKECYNNMFRRSTSLTNAPELPATTLAEGCYYGMFLSCSGLTTAPALPATTLANYCYLSMFSGCTSLTTAPELPATTLANNCYLFMFEGCTSLTSAPALPATTLARDCYYGMFLSCKSLNEITTYAQDISANSCLTSWVNGVSATGDFYNLGGANYPSGASGIPSGWTVHTSL